MRRFAKISDCGRYRYLLERFWEIYGQVPNVLTVCMLNPSTADALRDDATIRWLIGYAKKLGYTGLRVVNMAAFRATSPNDMLAAYDPHGPENMKYLARYCNGREVLCAWGANGPKLPRFGEMLDAMVFAKLHCLKTTKNGSPVHPLRQSHETLMAPWVRTIHE